MFFVRIECQTLGIKRLGYGRKSFGNGGEVLSVFRPKSPVSGTGVFLWERGDYRVKERSRCFTFFF